MDEQQLCDYLIGRIIRLSDEISPARYYSTMDWLRLHRDFKQLYDFCAILESEIDELDGNPGINYVTDKEFGI